MRRLQILFICFIAAIIKHSKETKGMVSKSVPKNRLAFYLFSIFAVY